MGDHEATKEEFMIGGIEMEDFSTEMNGIPFPGDLLYRSTAGTDHPIEVAAETKDVKEINKLNLKFSLEGASQPTAFPALNGTNSMPILSLPTETQKNEWRKELDSLWTMESKRKEQSKLREIKGKKAAEVAAAEGLLAMNSKEKVDNSNILLGFSGAAAAPKQQQRPGPSWGTLPFGLPYWDPSHRGDAPPRVSNASLIGKANVAATTGTVAAGPLGGFAPLLWQGPLGSQGSSSPVVSEFEGKAIGLSKGVNVHPNFGRVENKSKKRKVMDDGAREMGTNSNEMEWMLCVSTKGDIPNGRIIDGFFYKFKWEEEGKIVCVCHGDFFSPAEFIKHAGGTDVADPLQHIAIKSYSSFK